MSRVASDDPIDRAEPPLPTRTVQTVELAVFLFLIMPSMVISLFAIQKGSLSFSLAATAIIFRDLSLLSLVCYLIWRNGEGNVRIGWTWRHAGREVILGVILFVPFFFGAAKFASLLLHVGLSGPSTTPPSFLQEKGIAEDFLAVLLVAVVAVAEESIFRGYLLLRFQGALRNTVAAVLLSSIIFAVGHGYEGSAGLLTVGVMGAVFAIIYLWRGSLIAVIVMHFLQDFISVVLVPLLVRK